MDCLPAELANAHKTSIKSVSVLATCTTSAPKSLRTFPQNGPGARPPSSTTTTPLSAIPLYSQHYQANISEKSD